MKLQIRKVLLKNLQVRYLNLLLGIFMLTLGTISCDCGTGAKGGAVEEGLTMKVDPANGVLGNSQTIQVIFNLAPNATMANLEKYQLKISVEIQGTGKAELIYEKDANTQLKVDPTTPRQQSLSYFSPDTELTTNNSPIEISFDLNTWPGVTEANIKFELLNETGKVIEEGISVWKLIDLALERMGSEVLKGDKKTVELKIINRGTQKTEANQLKLKITRDQGNTAKIDGAIDQGGGIYSLNLPGEIDAGRTYITKKLVVNLGSDPEAVFKFKLIYKGQEQDGEVIVTCKQGTIEFHDLPKRFVGDHVVEFGLFNDSEYGMKTSDFTLELVSDNTATFEFMVEENATGSSRIKLEEIYRNQVIKQNEGFRGVKFRIDHPNGETKAGVVVKLKKGTQEVAVSEKILWESNGVELKLYTEGFEQGHLLDDTNVGKLKLENVGTVPTSTDEIKVLLTNADAVHFELGNVNGSNINTTLSKVLNSSLAINPRDAVSFNLKLAGDPKGIDKYGVELKLEIQYGDNVLKKDFLWSNREKVQQIGQKYNSIAAAYIQVLKEFSGPRAKKDQIRDDHAVLNGFCARILKDFGIRQEAGTVISSFIAGKDFLRNILKEEGSRLPDSMKQGFQTIIDVPDDWLVQEINKEIVEGFKLVEERSIEYLDQVKVAIAKNNKTEAQNFVQAVQKWVQVADRFAREIGISEAQELARKVNEYKKQAEGLVK